jgi:cyclopropane fatty-acyl-phospholipid synthase-like methyltransferase
MSGLQLAIDQIVFARNGRGCNVTGIDFLELPIQRAQRKATERALQAKFLVKDAWTERFDNVIDSGLFYVFSDDDRRRYVEGLATILKPGGRLFLMCSSDEEPGTQGPRRVSKKEIQDAFAKDWSIESTEPVQIEVRPDFMDFEFSEGGPKAWFVGGRGEDGSEAGKLYRHQQSGLFGHGVKGQSRIAPAL